MKIFFSKKNVRDGFTLIELLVVVSIISMLSSIIFSSLNEARGRARDSAKISAIKEVQKALYLYYADFKGYPRELSYLRSSGDYIKSIDPSIKYEPLDSFSSICNLRTTTKSTCAAYHLGIPLERSDNLILKTDANFCVTTSPSSGRNRRFNGSNNLCLNDGCYSYPSETSKCYDVVE